MVVTAPEQVLRWLKPLNKKAGLPYWQSGYLSDQKNKGQHRKDP